MNMNTLFVAALVLTWFAMLAGAWLGWQLLRQNGRVLLRLEELEKRIDELEFGDEDDARVDRSLITSAATNGDAGALENRYRNRSFARSKIKRDGLKAGTPAPEFCLPRLDGSGDLALSELRGKRVLLVFSSPHCGPCNALAPKLEKLHRTRPELELVMISKDEPAENRTKVKEHSLTFPILLQRHWEVSRQYAMFATPIAYLIDEHGVIAKDVALGVEPILELMDAPDAHMASGPEKGALFHHG